LARNGEAFGQAQFTSAAAFAGLSLQLWRHLATVADFHHDGKITEAEYKSAFGKGLLETPREFRPTLCTVPERHHGNR